MTLDATCAGLLPLLPEAETQPALRDEHGKWLSRDALRQRALTEAVTLRLPQKGLVFLRVTNRVPTVVALLAAAAAGHAIALIDANLEAAKFDALVAAYQPDLILSEGETVKTGLSGGPIAPELLLLLSTSGTTGSAKFVRLSAGNIAANAAQIAESLEIDTTDVGIGHLPLHYSYGLSVLTSHLAIGARVFLMEDAITSPSFWEKIADAGGTHFPGVPFHYTVLARFGLQVVPPCVRTFTQAGGALDSRFQQKVQAGVAERGQRFYVMYGQTEAAPRMTTLPAERFTEKLGSAGIALPGSRLAILDESGAELPSGATGQVHFYGPNVMLGYAKSRADMGLGDLSNGHLDTGDLGYLDAEGYLFLTGRTKRFAKIAGLRLGLDEIEKQIAAITPAATVDKGEKIIVFFEADVEADLKAHLKAIALEYKIPPISFATRRLDALPRFESGKINYARLKELSDV